MNFKRKVKKAIRIMMKDKFVIRRQKKEVIKWLGNEYGGFGVCCRLLGDEPIVYSFGIGEDVSFDTELIEKYNAEVYAFDPTPKSIRWVNKNVHNTKFHFYPYGISDKDEKENFYLPKNDNYVSGSSLMHDGLRTIPVEVDMFRLETIMNKIGHMKIDLLKIDIEGSEFKVITEIVNIPGGILQVCVEVHGRFFGNEGYKKNRELIHTMNEAGYLLVYVSDTFEELTFVKTK